MGAADSALQGAQDVAKTTTTQTTTTTTIPDTQQIQDLARTIADTGPDPVMLASVIIFGLIAVGTIIFLIRSYNRQQNKTLDYFQERSAKQEEAFRTNLDNQRDQFREELAEQRKVHVVELNRQSEMFERSLDKIVETHKRGMEDISGKLGSIDDRLIHVEGVISDDYPRRRAEDLRRSHKEEQTIPVPAVVELPLPDEPAKVTVKRTRRKTGGT